MTDNEIMKALECCVKNDSCKECPINPNYGNYGYCTDIALTYALDIINRQKAEIDRLEIELKAMRGAANSYKQELKKCKAEAIKTFAEELKKYETFPEDDDGFVVYAVRTEDIDKLVDEMEGEEWEAAVSATFTTIQNF